MALRNEALRDEPNVELNAKVCTKIWCFWPLSASTSSEVKNDHAHVIVQDIYNKFIELNFCEGCIVWQPIVCSNVRLPCLLLINYTTIYALICIYLCVVCVLPVSQGLILDWPCLLFLLPYLLFLSTTIWDQNHCEDAFQFLNSLISKHEICQTFNQWLN